MADERHSSEVCYWGLDPTFWIHRKVFIKTVFNLKQSSSYKGFYEFYDRIISKVEIHGIIGSVDERERLAIYKVDDGTGMIACCCWRETIKDSFNLGQSVAVQGKLTEYRGEKQLTVENISLEDNLNAESLFWLDVVNLSTTLYNLPFALPENLLHCDQVTKTITAKCLLDVIQQLYFNGKSGFTFAELFSITKAKGLHTSVGQSDEREVKPVDDKKLNEKHLREVLCQLEKQGEIFYKDPTKDKYEIITYDKHLKPAILKAIKEICKGSLHDGARVSRIAHSVRASQHLGRLPHAKIIESLKKLVNNSEVYQASNQVYCLV